MDVNANAIEMINGDSETITVIFKNDGVLVPLVTGDIVDFTVKRYADNTKIELQKRIETFTDGRAVIVLNPEDTINLAGAYEYDIQITRVGDIITTFVPPSPFIVRRGVTP